MQTSVLIPLVLAGFFGFVSLGYASMSIERFHGTTYWNLAILCGALAWWLGCVARQQWRFR